MFEYTFILREAILSVPASSLIDAAIQLAAFKMEFELRDRERNLSPGEKKRRDLVLSGGLDSIGEALRFEALQIKKVDLSALFPNWVTTRHAIEAEEYLSELRRTLPAECFEDPTKPAEAA